MITLASLQILVKWILRHKWYSQHLGRRRDIPQLCSYCADISLAPVPTRDCRKRRPAGFIEGTGADTFTLAMTCIDSFPLYAVCRLAWQALLSCVQKPLGTNTRAVAILIPKEAAE